MAAKAKLSWTEKHVLPLSSGDLEIQFAEDSEEDAIWLGDGRVVLSPDEWDKAAKFVERVRNF